MQETYELFLNLKNGLHSKIDVFNKMLDTIQKEKRIIEGEKTFNSFDEWLTSHILFFGNDVIYRAKRMERQEAREQLKGQLRAYVESITQKSKGANMYVCPL